MTRVRSPCCGADGGQVAGDGGLAHPALLVENDLSQHGKGLVFGAALRVVVHRLGYAMRVDGQHFAQVKALVGQKFGGEINGQWQLADPRSVGVKLGQIQDKAPELLTQGGLGGGQHAPDLRLTRSIRLTQGAHVAVRQGLHEFFDLVLAQVVAQQANAPALVARLKGVTHKGHNHHQYCEFHGRCGFAL
jgi:hypothetical protein